MIKYNHHKPSLGAQSSVMEDEWKEDVYICLHTCIYGLHRLNDLNFLVLHLWLRTSVIWLIIYWFSETMWNKAVIFALVGLVVPRNLKGSLYSLSSQVKDLDSRSLVIRLYPDFRWKDVEQSCKIAFYNIWQNIISADRPTDRDRLLFRISGQREQQASVLALQCLPLIFLVWNQ